MLNLIKSTFWVLFNNSKLLSFAKYKAVNNAMKVMRAELYRWLNEQSESSLRFRILDVGGGDGNNIREFLGEAVDKFDIINLDIEEKHIENALCADITKPCSDTYCDSFDIVYSYNAFEHFCDPHIASDNIYKMLKPNGLCIIHTVFSWRYHPVPKDYFRYTDDALVYLFSERNKLTLIGCGYDLSRRRENILGGYLDDRDIPPIDLFGGFRENWGVYYIGYK